jgi:anaerobic ribonucleoside-triphosphate reductase
VEQLQNLNHESLRLGFSSSKLKIENEDYVLDLVFQLVRKDFNFNFLFQYVQYSFVSETTIFEVLKILFHSEVDETFLESLQEMILADVSIQTSQIPVERYFNAPKTITKEEIEKAFMSFKLETNNEEIQRLRRENQDLKGQIEQMDFF